MANSPWIDRFLKCSTREQIRTLAKLDGTPFVPSTDEPYSVAVSRFEASLRSFFYCTDQVLDILEALIGCARAHATEYYPSVDAFRATIYKAKIEERIGKIIAITGPAGVGKSALIDALVRILLDLDDGVQLELNVRHPIRTVNRVKVLSNKSLWSILAGLESDPTPGTADTLPLRRKRPDPDNRIAWARRHSFSSGICLNVIDELQFLTRSERASTRATEAVFTSSSIGLPTAFLLNYSFGHKAKRRPQEERDRLFGSILYLIPDEPESPCWVGYLAEVKRNIGSVLEFDIVERALDIYGKSAGLPRKVTDLLILSYGVALKARGPTALITWSDVVSAYESRSFAVARKDVELMLRQAVEGKMQKGHQDLWCPFDESVNRRKSVSALATIQAADSAYLSLVEDSLTASERIVVKQLRAAAKAQKRRGKVRTLGPNRKMDVAALIKNAAEVAKPN